MSELVVEPNWSRRRRKNEIIIAVIIVFLEKNEGNDLFKAIGTFELVRDFSGLKEAHPNLEIPKTKKSHPVWGLRLWPAICNKLITFLYFWVRFYFGLIINYVNLISSETQRLFPFSFFSPFFFALALFILLIKKKEKIILL